MDDTEFITYQQMDRHARRIEKKNFDTLGYSLSFTGISRFANPFIICLHPGRDDEHGEIEIRKGWREAMRQGAAKWMEDHPK